jgi:drug/metabolite transporter (DMT)-like permease
LAATGASVIATSAILIRLAGESPGTAAFFRCAYALPALLVLVLIERRRDGPGTRGNRYSLLAGLLFGGTILLQNYAIDAVGAAIATVVANLQVLFVALAGWLLFAERPTGRFFLALPPALAGVVLVSGSLDDAAVASVPGVGILLCVLTSLAYATFLLAARRGQRDGDPAVRPLAEITAVAAVVAGVFGAVDHSLTLAPSWPAQGWLLLLALGPQAFGWLLITTSMRHLPVALAALLLLLQPLVAVVLANVLLDEQLSVSQLVGCAILLAAVVFASRAKRPVADVVNRDS